MKKNKHYMLRVLKPIKIGSKEDLRFVLKLKEGELQFKSSAESLIASLPLEDSEIIRKTMYGTVFTRKSLYKGKKTKKVYYQVD